MHGRTALLLPALGQPQHILFHRSSSRRFSKLRRLHGRRRLPSFIAFRSLNWSGDRYLSYIFTSLQAAAHRLAVLAVSSDACAAILLLPRPVLLLLLRLLRLVRVLFLAEHAQFHFHVYVYELGRCMLQIILDCLFNLFSILFQIIIILLLRLDCH